MGNGLVWNGDQFMANLTSATEQGMLEVLQMLQEEIQNQSRIDTGQTRDSYEYAQEWDGSKLVGQVGSNHMNAIYEEFGTGEYAENGDGRQGGWVYYNERRREFVFTTGKEPNKPMRKAFSAKVSDVERYVQDALGRVFDG